MVTGRSVTSFQPMHGRLSGWSGSRAYRIVRSIIGYWSASAVRRRCIGARPLPVIAAVVLAGPADLVETLALERDLGCVLDDPDDAWSGNDAPADRLDVACQDVPLGIG